MLTLAIITPNASADTEHGEKVISESRNLQLTFLGVGWSNFFKLVTSQIINKVIVFKNKIF